VLVPFSSAPSITLLVLSSDPSTVELLSSPYMPPTVVLLSFSSVPSLYRAPGIRHHLPQSHVTRLHSFPLLVLTHLVRLVFTFCGGNGEATCVEGYRRAASDR
jgi:hypothetical protein